MYMVLLESCNLQLHPIYVFKHALCTFTSDIFRSFGGNNDVSDGLNHKFKPLKWHSTSFKFQNL